MTPRDQTPVTERPALADLAGRLGVATEYWDWQGRHQIVSAATVTAVLTAFGYAAGSDAEVADSLRRVDEAHWRRMLPTVLVGRGGQAVEVLVHVRHGDPLAVDVLTEGGDVLPGVQAEHNVAPRELEGGQVGEAKFVLPADLPLGYHTVRASSPDRDDTCLLVVAPDRLELPDLPRQAWGLMTQLYSARSRESWGLGDFADLAALGEWGATSGADFVLVNPLHAAEPVPPIEDSPYLPTTRRYLNPIYVRVENITEYAALDEAARQRLASASAAIRATNTTAQLLDREAVWTAKLDALAVVAAVERTGERERAWLEFRQREGAALTQFGTWCALAEHFSGEWPEEALDPASRLVADLAAQLADRAEFFAWLQWIADEQLAAAQAAATGGGMRVGLMTDLAVGVHPAGAEVWTLGPALARGVSVGAPPDAFNQRGQDWSQPPWRPDQLAELGYAPYRAMLRTALRHAGGLRIDHVMGLFRLWCIPEGMEPGDGTYLRYDHEAMISILLLEAHRAGAFVVGEDLGVVEPFVRDHLAERGILGTSILWFEADDGVPRAPESYRELCLATVTTHDLPPTAGFLAGDHIRLREELGLLTQPVAEEVAGFERERDAFLALLRDRGLIGPDAATAEIVEALHVLLTAAPSRLLGVMLSDLVGDRRTQNQPGTYLEYPNWRVPLTGPEGAPVLLEDLPTDPLAQHFVARLRDAEATGLR